MRTLLFTRVLALGVGVASAAAATSPLQITTTGRLLRVRGPSSPSGAQREPAPVTESRHVEHHHGHHQEVDPRREARFALLIGSGFRRPEPGRRTSRKSGPGAGRATLEE